MSPNSSRVGQTAPLRRFLAFGLSRDNLDENGTDIVSIAVGRSQCLSWVKLRRTQYEHMFSGLPLITDIELWHFRYCGKMPERPLGASCRHAPFGSKVQRQNALLARSWICRA